MTDTDPRAGSAVEDDATLDDLTHDDLTHEDATPDDARPRGLRHSRGWIFGTMLFSALCSLTAAWVLSYDAIVLAGNPDATFGCDISSVLSCSSVGLSWQASLFGFPNAFLGMVCEPVVITIAVASLGGVRFPRWFMFSAQVVYLFGLAFAFWLFAQSMWVIGALCPWCLVITVGTTLVFMTLLHHNILEDNLYLPPAAQRRALTFVRSGADVFVSAGIVVVIATLIVSKYGAALLA